MRILHVVLQLRVGGQERFILNLSRELARRGHEVGVIALVGPEEGDLRPEFGAIPVIDVTKNRSPVSLYARLTWAMRTRAPDVVHTHNPSPLIYGVAAARFAGVPRVIHTKHGANLNYTRKELAVARLAARSVSAFVSVSDGTAVAAREREHPPAERSHVIPNGVPLEQFGADPSARARVRAELGIPEDAVVVGSVGRLVPEKDYPFLVEAAAPLVGPLRGTETHLVLVGEGTERPRIEGAIAAHVRPEARRFVHMTGARSDVPRVLAALDVFVLSSRTEGLPLVIPEAMASRLPVIATAVGGLPGIVPREVGRLVPHGDVPKLRAAIEELTSSKGIRHTLGAAAHAYAHERFSLARMTTAYERLYSI
jgi:glycosyltransferase involved in cell wall biosynthesis